MLRKPPNGRHETYMVPMVHKVFTVLEAFRANRNRLSFLEVTESCGLSKASAFRILESLQCLGYISRDGTGHYRLTYRLLDVAMAVQERSSLCQAARPHLESLYRQMVGTVNLGLIERNELVYADVLEVSRRFDSAPRPGARGPLHATALGKAIAAWLPPDELDEIIRSTGMPPFTNRTITAEAALHREMANTRQRGYAIDDGEERVGWMCVAAPLFDFQSRLAGAVSITTPVGSADPDKVRCLGDLVRGCAEKVSLHLGLPVSYRQRTASPVCTRRGLPECQTRVS